MNKIYLDIFRAVYEGKWLKIEYQNKENEITNFWIGILDLKMPDKILIADGLHLGKYTLGKEYRISIDRILSSEVVEGTYCEINEGLIEDIDLNPEKYRPLFEHTANLKILNYLELCNRMDTVPYHSDFTLIPGLDRESFYGMPYELTGDQFKEIVKHFRYREEKKTMTEGKLRIRQLAINVLSIHTPKGLYVLAYRKLHLDVKRRMLTPAKEIQLCCEFFLEGQKENIRKYLDGEEYDLLLDFEKNQEKIKDCITKNSRLAMGVDDLPYLIGLGMDIALDLQKEYQGVVKNYHGKKPSLPLKAFFGDLVTRPVRTKDYPMILLNKNINPDQLLAIHHGMKYPLTYIQGPPGTGKTSTIINAIITAFFNEKTILFTSYNNHPIQGVYEKLSGLIYQEKKIPFPVLRLGNVGKVEEALDQIKEMYESIENIPIFESTLERRKDERKIQAKTLSGLLKRYEEVLELKDRKEAILRMMDYQAKQSASFQMLPFQTDLQGRQLAQIDQKIEKIGEIDYAQAMDLVSSDSEQLLQYLYYTSVKHLKQLGKPSFQELYEIIFEGEKKKRVENFHKYISKTENLKKLQKVFPVIITTCISAHRLGEPEPSFDLVIMDEASQCNIAVSLVPILRGENLMLVGDPQQLNPVILLDDITNRKLRKKYRITEEYDYRKNSIYKTFLACDSVSDEVLLHHHYRCHEKIIEFNNKKYYHSKLNICSECKEEEPLLYLEVKNEKTVQKNTALGEVEAILDYALKYEDKTIGVITPFVNQRKMIEEQLRLRKITNVDCGTVHSFQGDEKDIVFFSTVLTENTGKGTYQWLKNNKELINVATSRAKEKLVVLSDSRQLHRLRDPEAEDDLWELVEYVKKNGDSKVSAKQSGSRALGVKPFSSMVEEAFLQNLTHALENIWLSESRFVIQREVPVDQVFLEKNMEKSRKEDLFYGGKFDFVIYEKGNDFVRPVLAIELEGKEHFSKEAVKRKLEKKRELCRAADVQLIQVENTYARRYNHMKEILLDYFSVRNHRKK